MVRSLCDLVDHTLSNPSSLTRWLRRRRLHSLRRRPASRAARIFVRIFSVHAARIRSSSAGVMARPALRRGPVATRCSAGELGRYHFETRKAKSWRMS